MDFHEILKDPLYVLQGFPKIRKDFLKILKDFIKILNEFSIGF